jgi:hypothetical protein
MATDWNEARLDRLGKRIDRIEQERRDERQRAFERRSQIFVVIFWLVLIAIVAISTVAAATN